MQIWLIHQDHLEKIEIQLIHKRKDPDPDPEQKEINQNQIIPKKEQGNAQTQLNHDPTQTLQSPQEKQTETENFIKLDFQFNFFNNLNQI